MKLSMQIFLGFLIAISIGLLDSFVNYTLTVHVRTNSDFLERSEAVIRHSDALSKGMVEMQSAFRGFLLTGDGEILEPFYEGQKNLPRLVEEERALVTLPGQRVLLDSIVALHEHWVSYAEGLIVGHRKAVGFLPGDNKVARIPRLFQRFDDVEYRERDERRKALTTSIDRTDWYSLLFCVLVVVVGLGIAMYLVRKISVRIGSLVTLAEGISRGDFGKVQDKRRDELSSLSISLNLMSERLSRNIGALEKKNQELNEFAYVVSHDLKAPVRGIASVVQWIHEDLTAEISHAMHKYLEFIVNRIRRMEGLIDGLLEYARAGRVAAVHEMVDVKAMIGDLVATSVPKGYSVHLGLLPNLYTEKLPLQQVFDNLISNAVKYTPPGEAVIWVTCMEQAAFYEFSVKDNGPGISPAYHEKVFGIFQTLREKEDKESTGIGLAIVRKIVEERGGTVRLVSDVGKGAAFIFTWPKQTQ